MQRSTLQEAIDSEASSSEQLATQLGTALAHAHADARFDQPSVALKRDELGGTLVITAGNAPPLPIDETFGASERDLRMLVLARAELEASDDAPVLRVFDAVWPREPVPVEHVGAIAERLAQQPETGFEGLALVTADGWTVRFDVARAAFADGEPAFAFVVTASKDAARARIAVRRLCPPSLFALPWDDDIRRRITERVHELAVGATPIERWIEDVLGGAIATALRPPVPAASWATWFTEVVLPFALARASSRGSRFSAPVLEGLDGRSPGQLSATWRTETVTDVFENTVVIGEVSTRAFTTPVPDARATVIAKAVARKWAARIRWRAQNAGITELGETFHGLDLAQFVLIRLAKGNPPRRSRRIRPGRVAAASARELRRCTPKQLALAKAEARSSKSALVGFRIADDELFLNLDFADRAIYLRRAGQPLVRVLRSDPVVRGAYFCVDSDEPAFRGFAEWLRAAVVKRGLDRTIKLDADAQAQRELLYFKRKPGRMRLRDWLEFNDYLREPFTDWRLEVGMVAEGGMGRVRLVDQRRARATYYELIRAHLDPTFRGIDE